MSTDTSHPRSRRAVLAAAVGAAAASAAGALARPPEAHAADPNDVVLGANNESSSVTTIHSLTSSVFYAVADSANIAIQGYSNGYYGGYFYSTDYKGVGAYSTDGIAIDASSAHSYAVYATTAASGVPAAVGWAQNHACGVVGYSNGGSGTVPAGPPKTGIYGYADQDVAARGVVGQTTVGQGVRGVATTGIGVRGAATSGVAGSFESATGSAIQASGRVILHKVSGLATLAANATTVTVTPGVDIVPTSLVLITPQGDPGSRRVWVTKNVTANTFTIRASASAATSLAFAWLVLG